ncbi:replication initiator [Nonomuraea sp. NPDC023979]|uniref:replication initiator n=1 Tax=Nonomuraea sp. NPDC023979 TaxID=3154796 RepID=UPI0033D8A6D4
MPRALAGARLLSPDIARVVAEQAGVCIRPLAMWVQDQQSGERRLVNVACGARLESACPPCARRNRLARMAQCQEGWHLEAEPERRPSSGNPPSTESAGGCMIESAGEASTQAASAGRRVRSTRRRQDAPRLPKRDKSRTTLGRTFTTKEGKVLRPSMFVTLTLPSYGRVRDGVPVEPGSYDYRRAARDALHFSKLVDRFVQNLRRVAGWEVQYFAAVEFQRRLAPHLHMAIRGTLARAEVRQVVAATYHQVWWPSADRVLFDGECLPVWTEAGRYIDPATGEVLSSWEEALDQLASDAEAEPLHVVQFGDQVDMQGVLSGTADADRCVRYLAKYLTKAVSGGALHTSGDARSAQRRHVGRLLEALRYEPCSPACANWLRYGVEPKRAKVGLLPGHCRGKAHRAEHLGYGGRRVLVSRKWSGKTLGEYTRERRAWVLQTLGAEESIDPDRFLWRLAASTDPDVPRLAVRLLDLVAERQQLRRKLAQASTEKGENVAGAQHAEARQ